tara:strand:+ start:431 stop:730 length:300 start_codon:yes stop_codon:yes gene_type:complete
MYKGEYLTGDFQTFTVYENGKVVAKRKTRKPVNFVIKHWKGWLKNGKGAWKYSFTFERKPDLDVFNKYADDDVKHGRTRRYAAIFNENNEATIEERENV